MKKFFLSFFVFVASAGYVAYQYVGGGTASASVPAATTPPTTQVSVPATPVTTTPVSTPVATTPPPVHTPTPVVTPTPTPTPVVTPPPAPTPAPVVAPKGQYADGSYTGSSADAYYGTVQVQAVIQNGKLTAVNFLQYPSSRDQNCFRLSSETVHRL